MNDATAPTFSDTMHEVAPLLGEGWKVTDEEYGWGRDRIRIGGPDGAVLHASLIERGRVEVTCEFTGRAVYTGHRYPSERITVALSRGAAVVAREITRRVLSTYLPALAQWTEKIVQEQERHDAEERTAEEIRKALRGETRRSSVYGRLPAGAAPDWDAESRQTSFSAPARVEFEATASARAWNASIQALTASQAVRLALFLATLHADA